MTGPARRPETIAALARDWWVVLLAVPFGLGAWAGFLYIGLRMRRWRWLAYAALYLGLAIGVYVLGTVPVRTIGTVGEMAATLGSIGLWVVTAAHGLHARREFAYRTRLRQIAADVTTERRLAVDLARRQPRLARAVGIGRPDVPGAQHANLVDVNSAPASVLARLPGLDDAMARQIVELRPYSSVEDLGSLFELPARDVEELRERTIFIRA